MFTRAQALQCFWHPLLEGLFPCTPLLLFAFEFAA